MLKLEMNDIVAVITLDRTNRGFSDLKIVQKQFRFKCKRCAALCCKLGGPVLSTRDVEAIEKLGVAAKDFLDQVNGEGCSSVARWGLKSREDGSCVFLQKDNTSGCFRCGIYDCRPALCRLYPFRFEMLDKDRVALKCIPCCLGLNNSEGNVLDEEFVSSHLLEPLLEAIELQEKGKL